MKARHDFPQEFEVPLLLVVQLNDASTPLGLRIPALTRPSIGPFIVEHVQPGASSESANVVVTSEDSSCVNSVVPGDEVVAVDGVTPTSNVHLYQLLNNAKTKCCIALTIHRHNLIQVRDFSSCFLKSIATIHLQEQPPTRRRILQTETQRNDYVYFIAQVQVDCVLVEAVNRHITLSIVAASRRSVS